jgi:signal transduction histidine kinase
MRASRRLLLIFSATVLVPGLILGVFGFRALQQERREAERRARETLDVVAESRGHQLEAELKDWQQAAEALAEGARNGSENPSPWPARVRNAVAAPGSGVVLLGSREHAEAFPAGQLLFELSTSPEEDHGNGLSDLFREAESFELRTKQLDRAIPLYRQLTASTDPRERVQALHALARTFMKAGQTEDALHTFHLLEREPPVRIGLFPSDLLALFQIASLEDEGARAADALRLYRGLVEGRWRLDRLVYETYAERARGWIPESAETLRLNAQEEQKKTLTLAVERFLASPRPFSVEDGTANLAFWNSEPFAAIVLSSPYLQEHLLPKKDRKEFELALTAPGGQALVGNVASAGETVGTYTLQNTSFPLRVQVRPQDPATLYSGVNRQQNLYVAMLAVLLALLVLGGYFTIQTLKSELAVAQMKSDFVSTVSHEFRSPLAGINQLGEMLRDGRVPDENRRHEYYGMIVDETQRLRRLVENVLDFARIEDGRQQYRFEPVEPAKWLNEVAEDFQSQVAGRGFAVEAYIPKELPCIVADRETLTTAVHNLLDNAVKYSRDSNTVRLEARSNGDGLSISVCDCGVGIREEDRPRIFEKFYRGGGELSRQVKGVGLGLNLVQHIVAAHGGTIDVDSREGEGSTFTIHLKSERRPA